MPRRSARSERGTASPDPTPTPTPIKSKKSPSKKNATAGKRSVTAGGIFVIGKGDDDDDVVTRRRNTSSVDSSAKHRKQQHQEEEDEEDEDDEDEDDEDEDEDEEEKKNSRHPEGALLAHLSPAARFVAAEVITLVLLAAGRRVQTTLPPLTVSLAVWRAVETALAWRAGLEPVDVGLAALVAYAPVPWLMVVFYGVSPAVASFAIAVDFLSPLVGFYLVGGGGGGRKLKEENKDKDKNTPTMDERIVVSLLATAVYAATISLALRNILPRVFVLDFAGIPTVEPAYGASFAGVVPLAAAFGFAVCEFVYAASFRDAAVVVENKKDKDKDKEAEELEERIRRFDPVDASLGETLWWNLCGYSRRARAVWARAALVSVMTAVGTYLACRDGVDGVTCWGAVAYAAVWAVATAATGLALGLVGRD